MSKRRSKKNQTSQLADELASLLSSDFGASFLQELLEEGGFAGAGLLDPEMAEEREALLKNKRSPAAKAQALVYEAETEFKEQRRRSLLEKALKTFPDCVDAHYHLASMAESADDRLQGFHEAVAAGRRGLGAAFLDEQRGHIWSFPHARPFLRACAGLTAELWHNGQHDQSIALALETLDLDLEDALGMRFALSNFLLQIGRDAELQVLLDRFESDEAEWLYHRAICAFRQEGDTEKSRALLRQAHDVNAEIASLLVHVGPLPHESEPMPPNLHDAMWYITENRSSWMITAGAIPWVRSVLNPGPLDYEERSRPKRKKSRRINWEQLRELPQSEQVWQIDHINAPIALPDEDEVHDSWLWLVAEVESGKVLDHELCDERMAAAAAFERLVKLMISPSDGDSSRPLRIETRVKYLAKTWQPKLEKIGVELLLTDELEVTDSFIDQMMSMVNNSEARSHAAPTDEELLQIPLAPEVVWQIDHRQVPTWIETEGQVIRPWMVLVANRTEETIIGQQVSPEAVAPDEIWRTLAASMLRPNVGEPQRPGRIEITSPALRSVLMPHLDRLGIQCSVRDNLDQLDAVFADFGNKLSENAASPALIDAPGMTPEQMGDFFSAAADFFRCLPWRAIAGDAAIRVECPKYRTGTWYAVVMGQSGITLGLAMYDSLEMLHRIMQGGESDSNARKMSGMSVLYGEAFDMSPKDVEAIERFGWEVATSEAYPQTMWLDPGMSIRAPLVWELELLTGTLRALPEFLRLKPKEPLQLQIPTVNGKLDFQLTWV